MEVVNAYMGEFFSEFFLTNEEFVTEIPFRKRFLDDIFGFANMTLERFQVFVNQINNWSKSAGWGIELTVSGVGTSVPYLDTEVYLSNGEWHTKLFSKATNVHAYLHPNSFHPSHIVRNIPYMAAFRIRRICSQDVEYHRAAAEYTDVHFARRFYKRFEVLKAFRIAGAHERSDLLTTKVRRTLADGVVPFVFPYTLEPKVKSTLRRLFPILAGDPHTASVFTCPQQVTFKRGRSIKDIMVRASSNNNTTTAPRSYRRKEANCPLHDSNLQDSEQALAETDSVFSFRFHKMFKIQGSYTCTSQHVIYVIACTRCMLQGVGECQDPVERIKKYIRAAQQDVPSSNCAIERHFQVTNHVLSDLCVFLVDGVPAHSHNEPGIRADRVRLENLWIKRIIGTRDGGLNDRCQWHHSMGGGSAHHPRVTL